MSQNHKLRTSFFLVRFLFTVVQTFYGSSVQFSPLGRWADMRDDIRDNMSVELHINNVCRSAYSELRCISTIRHLLSADSTKTPVSAFVPSRLDYCNSHLSDCPKHFLEKLQKVQNSAARRPKSS